MKVLRDSLLDLKLDLKEDIVCCISVLFLPILIWVLSGITKVLEWRLRKIG